MPFTTRKNQSALVAFFKPASTRRRFPSGILRKAPCSERSGSTIQAHSPSTRAVSTRSKATLLPAKVMDPIKPAKSGCFPRRRPRCSCRRQTESGEPARHPSDHRARHDDAVHPAVGLRSLPISKFLLWVRRRSVAPIRVLSPSITAPSGVARNKKLAASRVAIGYVIRFISSVSHQGRFL
jgi:hypothetical protein